ncbi:MAG: bifunctional precorrin-2 dehydrogenase/sirohydrochlorin ferrochelatase, partial [Clostridium sp.]|nr:bifunctional precorrin-2 dehydrogenase/sirohydrochlorin ferrochelatase [Clostridium sp.]
MESTFGYFPLFINLKGKQILIIGGGKIATRRFT